MATPIAARLTADSSTPLSPARRLQIFLIERRVAVSMVLFTLLIGIDAAVRRIRPHDVFDRSDLWSVAGLLLILAGLLIRSWAAGTLRKYKQLITTGPYALVRNPLYVGSFLMMGGFCTLVGDPWMLACVLIPMIALYWLAVRDEELLLTRLFPDQWPAYAARVPRFIPRPARFTSEGWSWAQWRKNHELNAWLGAGAAILGLRLWWWLAG